MSKSVVYLHGFLSSAQSAKARYLEEQLASFPQVSFHAIDFNPTPADFTYMTVTGRINRLRQYVLDHQIEGMRFVGSSLGGLIALHYAHRFGGVERMLLLAPAVAWLHGGLTDEALIQWEKVGAAPIVHPAFAKEIPLRYGLQRDGRRYLDPVPPAAPVTIIHGVDDETVPIDESRSYASNYPDEVDLVEVSAGHNLNAHLDLAWEYVESFLLENPSS